MPVAQENRYVTTRPDRDMYFGLRGIEWLVVAAVRLSTRQ